jgi:hypothetical protein
MGAVQFRANGLTVKQGLLSETPKK